MDLLSTTLAVNLLIVIVGLIRRVTRWFQKIAWEQQHDDEVAQMALPALPEGISRESHTFYSVQVPYWIHRIALASGLPVEVSRVLIDRTTSSKAADEGR